MTESTPWHATLKALTGVELTRADAQVWENELRMIFVSPPLGQSEVINAVRSLSTYLTGNTDKYGNVSKPTLQKLIKELQWHRKKSASGIQSNGHRETLEDAVCLLMRDACPHSRFSRAMAPSRAKYRQELIDALERSGKPVARDIRTHPRFMHRPADPFIRQQHVELIERHARAGTLDEDAYLAELDRLLAGAQMETIPRPINDPYARVASFAAAGTARADEPRARFEEDGL